MLRSERQPEATEGEGSAPEEEAGAGQSGSRRKCRVEDRLEIDGPGVHAAVTIDGGVDGGIALVGGEGGVLDIEELGADLEVALGVLAAVHPDGCAVGDSLGGSHAVVRHGEAELTDDIPKGCLVGGVEDDLVTADGGAGCAGDGVDGLYAMEEGELVAFKEGLVVVEDGLGELRHGGGGIDGEGAEGDAADEQVVGVERHGDAGQGAACNLVGCEDGTAVEFHGLGDIDPDHAEVGLYEGVVDVHAGRQFLEALAQHGIELLVDGAEVGPLCADVHLPLGAQGCCGLHGQFADDGARLGLTVEELSHLAADFGVYTEDFSHCVVPFVNFGFDITLI